MISQKMYILFYFFFFECKPSAKSEKYYLLIQIEIMILYTIGELYCSIANLFEHVQWLMTSSTMCKCEIDNMEY